MLYLYTDTPEIMKTSPQPSYKYKRKVYICNAV